MYVAIAPFPDAMPRLFLLGVRLLTGNLPWCCDQSHGCTQSPVAFLFIHLFFVI
jgi:hypothetical protein